MSCCNAPQNIGHKHIIARQVLACVRRTACYGCKGCILLLEVQQAFCHRRRVDLCADLDPSTRQIAQDVPPFGVQFKGWVCYTGDKTGHVEQIIDFGQIGVREGMSCKPSKNTARGQRTSGQDSLSDVA
ncbi:hypothetical protein HG531_011443 [Fusarium graminearum]|nr:hypothetical protein HG531_011443 [Fusarium graminearum]